MIEKLFKRFTVGQIVLFLLTVMIGIAAINIAIPYYYQTEVAELDNAIDVAGEQRLTTLQIVYYTDQIADGEDAYDQLEEAVERQEENFQALKHGGEAAGYDLDPPPEETRDQLDKQEQEWAKLRAHAITILEEPRDSDEFADSFQYIQGNYDEFIETADETTEAFATASATRIEFVKTLLIGLFGVNLLAFVGGAFLVRRDVGRTLSDVSNAITTMAEGSLEPRLEDSTQLMSEAYDDTTRNELMSLAAATERMEAYHKTALRQAQALAREDFDADVFDEDVPGEFGDALTDVHRDLRELIETFRSAIEYAGHSIVITDAEGVIEYVNPTYEEITGYDAEEAIGQMPAVLKSGEHEDANSEDVWETILEGDVWKGEFVDERKTGDRYVLDQTIAPILDNAGEPKKFVATQQEITKEKRREQQFMVFNRVLRHNLRNNLNVVMGYAELLEEELAPLEEFDSLDSERDLKEIIRYIKDDCDLPPSITADLAEIGQFVEDISDLLLETTFEGTKQIQQKSESLVNIAEKVQTIERRRSIEQKNDIVDIWPILEELAASYREEFPRASIELAGENASIRSNREDIRNIVGELLENALKHSDQEDPNVTLRVGSEADDKVRIHVEDTGPGIPDMERKVIEKGEEEPLMHGSGIGLWFVTWLVNQQGGTITIGENDPRGTIITVEFPQGDVE